MKLILLLLSLSAILGISNGQGGQSGGEVIWNDNIDLDEIGSSPIISISNDMQPYQNQMQYSNYQGAGASTGGTAGEKAGAQGEFESWSPQVSYMGDHFISEGNSFEIVCTLSAFDQLKWTHNGTPITFGENGYTVVEAPASQVYITSHLRVAKARKEHGGEYKCTAFSLLSHSIYILGAVEGGNKRCKFGSRTFSAEQKCYGQSGEYSGDTDNTKNLLLKHLLTLECKVVHGKDVKVDVNWFKNDELLKPDNDHYKFDRENSTLSVASASKDDVGVYRCETTNLPETHSFEINVIYFVTKSMPKSQTVLQGDKLALTCEVEGDPMPEITWLKDENDVVDVVNASRYTLNENEKGVANASLVIASAEYEDRADYTCMASIAGIKYNTTTYVRVKDMYDALWPFLGICAEVFILCVIIFIYEKRRAKADFDESDTDPQTEQKSHADQNKDSVRQRK